MRSLSFFLGATVCLIAALAAHADDSTATNDRQKLGDPTILLLRDDAVRAALACSKDQSAALDELFAANNRLLIAMRDVGPSGADETAADAIAELRAGIKAALTETQLVRLQGIVLQAQGYDALLRADIAKQLGLTPEQQAGLAQVGDEFRTAAAAARAQGGAPADVADAAKKLQSERHKKVIAELDDRQEALYGKLLGEPFDLAKVKPSPGDAPEFDSIEAWINSPPLTMASLRGQVVVVHFFAFGCSNCIQNYPWYREWQSELAGKGVTIIGIHTPETQTETDNELLQASLQENSLTFPVAIDKQKVMWQAWYNNIWPSVYIIDRRGRLRFWWYGELNWQGAGNQAVARRQIEQLLAEPE